MADMEEQSARWIRTEGEPYVDVGTEVDVIPLELIALPLKAS